MRTRCLTVCLLVLTSLLCGLAPAGAETAYAPPVDAPLVDRFRPPAHDYAAGNRGIDYGTAAGAPVRAAAAGEVVFAGRIGPAHHAVVLHPDGLRTSYSFLASVAVARGDRVERGDVLGVTGGTFHFGVRTADDRYLDPELLLAGTPPRLRLVPVRRSSEDERRGLLRALGRLVRAGVRATAAGVAWARAEVGAAVDLVRAEVRDLVLRVRLTLHYLQLPLHTARTAARAGLFTAAQAGCTPSGIAPPPRPPGRRIALLVGGFGSASGEAAVLDVDTRALGYADDDVAQFSYAGGQSPGRRRLAGIPTSTYRPADTHVDIRDAAERFRQLLHHLRLAHPGVPVDVIAHSQGGLVVRAALGEGADALDPRLPRLGYVVTLGTPHHGADVATLNAALGTSTVGQYAQAGAERISGGSTDGRSTAAAQLAEISGFLRELADRPLPAGARFTSIAARGDLVVPALQSGLVGATNVLVPVDGTSAHDALPGHAETARELALALAGRPPTCRSVRPGLLLAGAISAVEDAAGTAGLLVGLWTEGHLRR